MFPFLDDTTEGILWWQFKHKSENYKFLCYLPPENSSRRVDGNVFYDALLANIYVYQNLSSTFICGDLNCRCGDLKDFIPG